MSEYKRSYHNAYTNLAAAILSQAQRENDTLFLESGWANNLRYMCKLDDEMYGGRGTTNYNSLPKDKTMV